MLDLILSNIAKILLEKFLAKSYIFLVRLARSCKIFEVDFHKGGARQPRPRPRSTYLWSTATAIQSDPRGGAIIGLKFGDII